MLGFSKVDEVKQWHKQLIIDETLKNLNKNGFNAKYFQTTDECKEYLLNIIKEKDIISCGGSATLAELNIIDELEHRGNKVVHSFKPGLSKEEQFQLMREGMMSDVFLSSTNAITRDGKLYFVDGIGNRTSSIIFGPKKIIIVSGVNKIVNDIESAKQRVKEYAAPMNIRRYYKEGRILPPCVKVGKCCECKFPLRVCNIKLVLESKPGAVEFETLIVGKEIGF